MSNQQITEVGPANPVVVGDGTPWEYHVEYGRIFGLLQGLESVKQGEQHRIATTIVNTGQARYKELVQTGQQPDQALPTVRQEMNAAVNDARNGYGLGNAPGAESPVDSGVVSKDVEDALNVYRQAVTGGKPYTDIVNAPSTKIEGREVTASTAANPTLGPAALQEQTTVEATNYDTTAGDAAKAIQLKNLADLQATAQGGGAGQLAAAARMRQALLRNQQQASGNIQGARGYEKRGLRRAELQQRGERQLTADIANQAQSAQERQAAQQTIGQQAGQVRGQDIDVEATRAGFEDKRKTLQAQLDAARKANNQAAVNDFTKKLADLQVEVDKFNAAQTQTADTGNADRSVDVQDKNIDNARDDNDARIRAQKAIEDAAKGLLDENQKQEELKLAKRRLALAEEEFKAAQDEARRKAAQEKVQFWAGMVERLLGVAVKFVPKPAAAASGGLVTEPTLVAEGEHDELVIPVTGLTAALRKALAVDAKPFQKPVPVQALLKVLGKASPKGEAKAPRGIAVLLAASNQRAKKSAGAR